MVCGCLREKKGGSIKCAAKIGAFVKVIPM